MGPLEFYVLAVELVGKPSATPSEIRTGISRAYYAAFHFAKARFGNAGKRLSNHESHVQVADKLINCGDAPIQAAGRKLKTLKINRNIADYDISTAAGESKKNADAWLADAQRIIDAIEAITADSARLARALKAISNNGF